jgi:small redox-active disulfide protein 2
MLPCLHPFRSRFVSLHIRHRTEVNAMKNIKVLGTGCTNCKTTLKLIEDMAAAKGVAVQLEKVEEIKDIMGYGVMSTPGVVIDGKVVHAGGVPSRDKIEQWLAGAVPL